MFFARSQTFHKPGNVHTPFFRKALAGALDEISHISGNSSHGTHTKLLLVLFLISLGEAAATPSDTQNNSSQHFTVPFQDACQSNGNTMKIKGNVLQHQKGAVHGPVK